MMDEETSGYSSINSEKSVAVKHRRKVIPAKEKVDKTVPKAKPPKGKENVETASVPTEPPKEKKKTILEWICQAIEESGETKKGVSVQNIKKYVKNKITPAPVSINTLMNKAFDKGLEKGILERPPASKDKQGAIGFFRLPIKPPKPTIKQPKKQRSEEAVSDSEATEKRPKPRKRNLSDTYISEMKEASATSTPKPKLTAPPKVTKETKKALPKKKTILKRENSDSKLFVHKTKRKSLKSYSSDTDVDTGNKIKTAKPLKKAKTVKPKIDKATTSTKIAKPKGRKLSGDSTEKKSKVKSVKTKAKKEA